MNKWLYRNNRELLTQVHEASVLLMEAMPPHQRGHSVYVVQHELMIKLGLHHEPFGNMVFTLCELNHQPVKEHHFAEVWIGLVTVAPNNNFVWMLPPPADAATELIPTRVIPELNPDLVGRLSMAAMGHPCGI